MGKNNALSSGKTISSQIDNIRKARQNHKPNATASRAKVAEEEYEARAPDEVIYSDSLVQPKSEPKSDPPSYETATNPREHTYGNTEGDDQYQDPEAAPAQRATRDEGDALYQDPEAAPAQQGGARRPSAPSGGNLYRNEAGTSDDLYQNPEGGAAPEPHLYAQDMETRDEGLYQEEDSAPTRSKPSTPRAAAGPQDYENVENPRGALPTPPSSSRRPSGAASIPDYQNVQERAAQQAGVNIPDKLRRERKAKRDGVAGTAVEDQPYFWPLKKAQVEQSLKDSGVLGVYCARHCSQPGHYAITGISANIGLASLLFREEVEHNRYIYYAEINFVDRRFHSVVEVVQQFNKEKNLSFSTPFRYTP